MSANHTGEYSGWNSWIYNFRGMHDFWYGNLLEEGRRQAIAALPKQEGLRVLEVGIGSGLSLKRYPHGIHLTGIDPNAQMIQQAQRRARTCLADVTLLQMKGEQLRFPDSTFDAAVILHVLSVVEDARRLLREVHRVVRPGGSVIIVSAFHHENKFLQSLMRFLSKREMTRWIGFHVGLKPEDIKKAPGWELVRQTNVKPTQLFVLEKV